MAGSTHSLRQAHRDTDIHSSNSNAIVTWDYQGGRTPHAIVGLYNLVGRQHSFANA
jgi:hypothetical protein